MTHTEDGALQGVLIAGSVVFGVLGFASKLLGVWLWLSLDPQRRNDSNGAVSAKLTRFNRMVALVQAGLSLMFLAFVSIATILKIGSVERVGDGHNVNWLYLTLGEAPAFFLLGLIFAKFMWFDKDWQAYGLAGMWALWPVLLGTASLISHFESRLFLFLAAGAAVLGSVVLMFLASGGPSGPLFNNRGGLIGTLVLVCSLVLYFVYWYIGFENRGDRPGVSDNTRWHSFLVWMIAAVGAHVIAPALLMWCAIASPLEVSAAKSIAFIDAESVQPLASYDVNPGAAPTTSGTPQ